MKNNWGGEQLKKIVGMILGLVLLWSPSALAATKQEVIAAINTTYSVGSETFRLPQKIIDKATNFFNKKEMSSEQYDKILASIHKAVGIAQEAGTTDITKISKEDMQAALDVVAEASRVANVNLEDELEALKKQSNAQATTSPTTPIKTTSELEKVNIAHNTEEQGEAESEETSGETMIGEENPPTEEDNMALIQAILAAAADEKDENLGKKYDQMMTYIVVGIAVEIFINILIICLLFRSKWNRMIKKILIIVLVVVILISVYVLYYIFDRYEILKTAYELYYTFS